MQVSSLGGARVLIVDDETFVAMMLQDMLEELGCTVVAIAQNIASALRQASEAEFDVAVLDVNVGGELVTPVAARLAERGVPWLFSTGYGAAGLPQEWRGRPVLPKPFLSKDLERALASVLNGSEDTGPAASEACAAAGSGPRRR